MEIITFGKGERLMRAARMISRYCGADKRRLLLLPIPTTKDSRHINLTDTPLDEVLSLTEKNSLVVGYDLPRAFCEFAASLGAVVKDAGKDEDFLQKNAEVTARGALGYILTSSEKDIPDLKIGIIGYGRIGKALLRLLLFLGAEVKVYTTRESVVRELCEAGVECSIITESTDWRENEIILNTAPAKFISDRRLEDELCGVKFIDLASGQIFKPTENVKKLSSIPEVFYPETAGKLYAEYVLRALFEGVEV